MNEDGILAVLPSGVLANDSTRDGSSLSATIDVGPQHGSLTFNPDGSFLYTPVANFNGTDSFTYHAT
ncbi:Ig-like domain-containing protein, partial [Acinetobacter baumannii]